MSNTKIVIDYEKIGKKGYPYSWKELGLEPPTKVVEIETRQSSENLDATTEAQA